MRAPLLPLSAAILLTLCSSASAQEEGAPASGEVEAELELREPPAEAPVEAPAEAVEPGLPDEPVAAHTGHRSANSRRIAVLLLAASGVDRSIADDLTEVAIGAVAARGGATIVGKEEFQARLGQGEARTLDCVTSAACVGRMGVQLDVDEVVSGTLNRRGEHWVFDLVRIDVRSGELLGRAYRELHGDLGAVAAAVQAAIPELYVVHRPTASLHVTSGTTEGRVRLDGEDRGELNEGTLQLHGLEPGPHTLVVELPGREPITRRIDLDAGATLQIEMEPPVVSPPLPAVRISSLVWVGAGLALAGGGVALGFGLASGRQPSQGGTRSAAMAFLDDREREARIANVGLVGLGLGLGMAALGFLFSDFGARSTSIRASVTPRGDFMLQVGGSL